MRKRLWAGIVGLALCSCGSDPGYEPSYSGSARHNDVLSQPRALAAPSPEAPRETVEALQTCVDRLAPNLSPDHYAILFDLEATKNGQVTSVKIKDSMLGGSELEVCLTDALEQMNVPASAMNAQHGVTPRSRGMVGVVQAAAAPIALLPIVLVVGGVTILAVVTISVASGTDVNDVIDAARRRRPAITKSRCLDAAAGGTFIWQELCRKITDSKKAQRCWALVGESEEEKRNWCNEGFGTW